LYFTRASNHFLLKRSVFGVSAKKGLKRTDKKVWILLMEVHSNQGEGRDAT